MSRSYTSSSPKRLQGVERGCFTLLHTHAHTHTHTHRLILHQATDTSAHIQLNKDNTSSDCVIRSIFTQDRAQFGFAIWSKELVLSHIASDGFGWRILEPLNHLQMKSIWINYSGTWVQGLKSLSKRPVSLLFFRSQAVIFRSARGNDIILHNLIMTTKTFFINNVIKN
jgi:hypothetical protein